MKSPLEYFSELKDPRAERTRQHLLEETLLIAIAAVLSGPESWNDIEEYGRAKQDWLRTFLTLPGGIPSLVRIEAERFHKDLGRKRAGHAAQNFSLLNRIALNLLKQDKTCKLGVHGKRLTAAWDHPYLLRLLGVENSDASALYGILF